MIAQMVTFAARHSSLTIAMVGACALAGWFSLREMPLDALPELGDTQVLVYSTWERSADLVEQQITGPIVAALVGAPGVQSVRGVSDYGASFVHVIFDEGTDVHWARSRTNEYLTRVISRLPAGAITELGPDTTSVGWVFQYALVDHSGIHSLAELRTFHDIYLRPYLRAVRGVADVATVGGHVQQYQITIDPDRLRSLGLPIGRVVDAVRDTTRTAGGRVLNFGAAEYVVRGIGVAQAAGDFEQTVVSVTADGRPIRVVDIGRVALGARSRRGIAELDGGGEVVSGIVLMRTRENAQLVVRRIKQKLAATRAALPRGVSVEPVYDRSVFVTRAVENLAWTVGEVMVTVAFVIIIFLGHLPSALLPVLTIPVAVLIAFIPLHALGVTLNIMSLSGVAIAIGALVDASIVLVEQTHKRLDAWHARGGRGDDRQVLVEAMRDVAAPSFVALLIIAVAFLPVLTLEGEAGQLFQPLAYAKSICMIVGAVLAITLVPALRTRVHFGRIRAETANPLNRWLRAMYGPVAIWSLQRPRVVVAIAALAFMLTVPVATRLGSEFMPPLNEGTLLYMPTTLGGIPVDNAGALLQRTDRLIKQFPEVDRVLGKAGRADTATDPAPVSMFETLITLKPPSEWRRKSTWYSEWAPQWALPVLRRITPDRISHEDLVRDLDRAVNVPGLSNSWTMPIRARTTMLNTGIRTPLGVKVSGADWTIIDGAITRIESLLSRLPGTRSVFGERTRNAYFMDVKWRRAELARHGVSIAEAQAIVHHALGEDIVAEAGEGLVRYPVVVRYRPDATDSIDALARLPVAVAGGARHIPLGQLATITPGLGPGMIRNENGLLTGYVYVDVADRDVAGYVADASAVLDAQLALPAGYSVSWSGQFASMAQAERRLWLIVPLTLVIIAVLLYLNTRSMTATALVLAAVPFSLIGSVWLLFLLDYQVSVAVWVGLIALMGIDAQTGVFMLMYLNLAYEDARCRGRLRDRADLRAAVLQGSVMRLRPKVMTAITMIVGLLPMMWADGEGADVMKRVAAPLVGGLVTSVALELLVYPSLFELWRSRTITAPAASAVVGTSLATRPVEG